MSTRGIKRSNLINVSKGNVSSKGNLSFSSSGGASLYCFFRRQREINARDLIVITGCNSGLGYSLAMHCRAKGATVLAGLREKVPNFKSASEALENKGIIVQPLDITDERSVRDFRDRITSLLEARQLGKRRTGGGGRGKKNKIQTTEENTRGQSEFTVRKIYIPYLPQHCARS